MKKVIAVLVFAGLFRIGMQAQETNEASTLFGTASSIKKDDLGFFIGAMYGLTEIDRSMTSLLNARAGMNWKDKVSFGAYYTSSLNDIYPQSETLPNIYMDYWSVGTFVEYSLFSKEAIHVSFPLFLGYGEFEMDNEQGNLNLGEANFLQFEPSAMLELNLLKYLRFNLGAGYRFVEQMRYRNFNQEAASGLTGYAGLKIGLFK